MITLIHGDDISKSRLDLHTRKTKFPDTYILDGQELLLTDLLQELSSGGLFMETKAIFIENLLTKRKGADSEAFLTLLKNYQQTQDIILWEGKEVDKKTLESLGKITTTLYKIPQTLFAFLDSIKPGNTKQMLTLFHQTLGASEEEMVFFMLVRHFRVMIVLISNTDIEETKRMAPWQRGKMSKQASLFTQDQLLILYKKLYEIETGMKTGGMSLPLRKTIDIFLTEI